MAARFRQAIAKRTIVILAVCLVPVVGCGARQVVRNPNYGVVAIPSNSNSWPFHYRDEAKNLMAEHFPSGYEIVHEEETIVGETTTFNERDRQKEVEIVDGVKVSTSGSQGRVTTRDETEYRIHYRKR